MERKLTNLLNISLPFALFLAEDGYVGDENTNAISATSILKPLKQIILSYRVPAKAQVTDISTRVQSRMGHAIHTEMENVWLNGNYKSLMQQLGHPQGMIDRIVVNPDPKIVLADDAIVVYLERRSSRQLSDGTVVSGMFDLVIDGELNDTKTTTVYTYVHDVKAEDYTMQGSIYRWINPKLITSDVICINYLFTDWRAHEVKQQKNYPPTRILSKKYPLLSTMETEQFLTNKAQQIRLYFDKPQSEIPRCTDKELWIKPPIYKYFANPAKTDGRSTKNFDNEADANNHMAAKGVGVVIPKLNPARACLYCPAYSVCEQKDELIASGQLFP